MHCKSRRKILVDIHRIISDIIEQLYNLQVSIMNFTVKSRERIEMKSIFGYDELKQAMMKNRI